MGAPKITEEEKIRFRNKAKAETARMEKYMSDSETVKIIDLFKNKFNVCETVYKTLLTEYLCHKGKKETSYLKITMTQVPYVLIFAGYSFDKPLINEIFGASSQNGKTAKKLRDAVTHGVDEKAVREIINRKDDLFGYMDMFLDGIKNCDAVAI